MKFKTQYNAKKSQGETNTLPSLTIPDETMSIQEILRRYAKGLPIGGAKVPLYEGDEYFPDPRTMDLADREQMAREAKEAIQETQEKYFSKKPGNKPKPKVEDVEIIEDVKPDK